MSGTLVMRDEMPGSYPALVEAFGFIPNLFRLQSRLPALIQAEQRLIQAILLGENHLSRPDKEHLLGAVASDRGNEYCSELFSRTPFTLSDRDAALLTFARKLA